MPSVGQCVRFQRPDPPKPLPNRIEVRPSNDEQVTLEILAIRIFRTTRPSKRRHNEGDDASNSGPPRFRYQG